MEEQQRRGKGEAVSYRVPVIIRFADLSSRPLVSMVRLLNALSSQRTSLSRSPRFTELQTVLGSRLLDIPRSLPRTSQSLRRHSQLCRTMINVLVNQCSRLMISQSRSSQSTAMSRTRLRQSSSTHDIATDSQVSRTGMQLGSWTPVQNSDTVQHQTR